MPANQENGRSTLKGLRFISQQVINAIKEARYPITYKDLADRVTNLSLDEILATVPERCPGATSMDQAVGTGNQKGKNGTLNLNGELSKDQFRAVENYRRRIYDAWSVICASGII